MAENFTFYTPTKVVFGKDRERECGSLVRAEGGSRVLIHYGGQSAVRSGLISRVRKSLEEAGLYCVELGGVVPNPHLSKIREGIALGRKEGVDFVLAVGGGSVIDSSKAIAYGLAEDEDVWELFAKKRKASACLPVGVVLTIAASGSEMSNSAVITKEDEDLKRSYNDDLARPRFAVMNPALTQTLPDWQTEAGCTDIMMHTMERYFPAGPHMELTDCIAEGLLRTVMRNAEILHTDPDNYDARAEVMWAGSLSHNDLTGCGQLTRGDFVCHGLEHELSGFYDVTHGAGLAALWGSWARYVYRDALDRFVRFADKVFGIRPVFGETETGQEARTAAEEAAALAGIEALEAFFRRIGMPTNLSELGLRINEEDCRRLAASAAAACGGKKGAARVMYEEDMFRVYMAAR